LQKLAIDESPRPEVAAPVSTKRFGVLDRMVDDKEKKAKAKTKANATMSAAAFDKAIKEGMNWTGDHFAEPAALASYGNYYFYGIERMGALLDVEKIKTHDWYNEGADELLRRQLNDGSWNDSCGAAPATALTILFLTKATSSIINKTPKVRAVVIGGFERGLQTPRQKPPSSSGSSRFQNLDTNTPAPRKEQT